MNEPMKIFEAMDCYLPDVDGVVNCVHNYSLNLSEKADVTVVVPKNKRGYKDDFPYKVVRCTSMYIPVLKDHYGLPKFDKKFKKTLLNTDCDIIHVHSPFGMGKFALKIAKLKGVPIVGTFHSNMRTIFKSIFFFDFIVNRIIKGFGKLYNRYDEMFVCSEPVEEQLRSYGYTGKVTYLPFGTDFEKCEKVEEYAAEAEKVFDIEPRELTFVYIGRVMKLKRIDFILSALKKVKDAGVKFRFFVVGKGPELNKLKKYAKKLGFSEDEVTFTGFLPREQYPLLCSRADLLLFPSLYDNFGLVKLESASYKTPGLFIKGSCAGSDITDGVDGFLSEDSVDDFANKILQAVKDYDELKAVGKKAQDDLYIHWKDCADRLYENYERIIKEHKAKGNRKA